MLLLQPFTPHYFYNPFKTNVVNNNEVITVEYYYTKLSNAIQTNDIKLIKFILNNSQIMNTFDTIYLDCIFEEMLSTNNNEIIQLFFPYISNLEQITKRRFKYILDHIKDENLLSKPLYGLKYACDLQLVIDPLTSLEDIIDNYLPFEKYTGISILDKNWKQNIQDFLGIQFNNEEDRAFSRLRIELMQRSIDTETFIEQMTTSQLIAWKNFLSDNNLTINKYNTLPIIQQEQFLIQFQNTVLSIVY